MANYLETVADTANATETLVQGQITRELSDNATATDSMAVPEFIKLLASDANATESLSTLLAKTLLDTATASETLVTTGSFVRSLLDTAEASEALRAALLMVLSDNATASEAFTEIQQRFGVLVDRVLATDGLASTLDAVSLVTSAALASDLLSPSFAAYLADNASASDVLAARLEAVTSLLDIASATDTLTDRLSLLVVLADTAEASDSLTASATLIGLLESGATASVVLTIGGAQYTAWVLNTENIAVSQYSNYPFNSFAEHPDGRWFGAADDGLYLLDGDDDAGTAIEAYFRAPLTDFGFASLKRLPEVYIGYTADGDLVFKAVVVSPNGVKEEHWYQLAERPAAGVLGTRETSVPVGKGLKSVYWQFEVHNLDGADFQIETVRLWPMGLTRRVR